MSSLETSEIPLVDLKIDKLLEPARRLRLQSYVFLGATFVLLGLGEEQAITLAKEIVNAGKQVRP